MNYNVRDCITTNVSSNSTFYLKLRRFLLCLANINSGLYFLTRWGILDLVHTAVVQSMAGSADTHVHGVADVNIHQEATLCMWVCE